MKRTTEWAYLKDNPSLIFRIHLINPNNTIEYYLPNDVFLHHTARIEQICFIDNQDVLTSPKFNLTLLLSFLFIFLLSLILS